MTSCSFNITIFSCVKRQNLKIKGFFGWLLSKRVLLEQKNFDLMLFYTKSEPTSFHFNRTTLFYCALKDGQPFMDVPATFWKHVMCSIWNWNTQFTVLCFTYRTHFLFFQHNYKILVFIKRSNLLVGWRTFTYSICSSCSYFHLKESFLKRQTIEPFNVLDSTFLKTCSNYSLQLKKEKLS